MSFIGHQPTDSDQESIERLSETVAKNVQKISKNVNELKRIIDELASSPDADTFRNKVPGMQDMIRDSNNSLKELSQLSQMMASKTSTQQTPRHPIINNSNVFNRNTNPQFSVEKFMSRSRISAERSHFYEGKTVFGGANMSRAARLAGTTPYSLALRQQTSREVIPKVKFETYNEPLSSSSQRILEKLKTLSTPLNDAKRIPISYRRNDYFRDAELLHRTSKRPKMSDTPSFSLNDSGNSFQTKRTYRLVEIETTKDNKAMTTSDTIQPLTDSCDKYSNESIENKSNETFVGKMMRKDSKRDDKRLVTHTATNGGQNDQSFDLLTTAEPLTMPSSLPKFTFSSKPVEKPSVKSTTQIIRATEDYESNFKFSEPVLRVRDQMSDSIKTDKKGPTVADRKFESSSLKSSAITNKISIDSRKVEKESNVSKDVVKESANIQSVDSKQTNDGEIKTEIKKSVGNTDQWVCPRCVFTNNCSDEKCKACNRDNQIKAAAPSLSASTPSSDLSANKTIPSETTATIGWGQQFKPKAGSWTCSTCCVTNDSNKSKCVACEEPKPGANLSNSTNQSSLPKPKTWLCYYCKHNNEESNRVCSSCAKLESKVATREELDKLLSSGPPIKFGLFEGKSSPKNDKKVEENTEVSSKPINTTFLPKQTESSSEKPLNTFVFGSTSLAGDKTKVSSASIQSNDITSQPLFKFGVPSAPTESIPEFKSPEKSNTTIADIFGSNKTTNSSVTFNFGAVPQITSPTSSQQKPEVNKSSAESTFSFGINEDVTKNKSREKRKPIHLENESNSEMTSKLPTNQSEISFQIPKTIEDKPLFKAFTSTASGSLFGLTTSSSTSSLSTVTTTASITSFTDNKFSPLNTTETQNKSIGSLFGGPATTTSSNISFSSPFSLTNSFSSGQTSNTGQNNTEDNGVKSLFSMPSSSIKPLISSQPNPLVSSSSVSSSAPLNSITSSSPKGLVFGNSNQSIQPFTSQPSIATTKPNFSFNLGAKNTSANTTATTAESTTFGTNSTAQFGSNPNKGFSFGNPTLGSSQTPSFSFTNPTTNLLPNSTPQMSFGLNSNSNNTISADTNSKPSNLFQFGGQTTDQFSSSSTQKTLNNMNNNLKTSSQFSFGILPSNPSTGQTNNNNNLFANAINSAPNSLSFTQLGSGTGAAAASLSSSPFTFGGFNSSTPSMPQMQSQPQQQQSQTSLPPPQFNFSAQPSFDFASMTNADNTPSAGPVFQFSADNTTQAVAPNRNIKRAKRRLPNTTT